MIIQVRKPRSAHENFMGNLIFEKENMPSHLKKHKHANTKKEENSREHLCFLYIYAEPIHLESSH